MLLQTSQFILRPIRDPDERADVLRVYEQCADFLALGPAPASMEMVVADIAHSQEVGGLFCGIYDPASGEMLGIVDFLTGGFEGDPQAAFLALLMIAAPHRRRGLGTAVVAAVEAEIRARGQARVIVSGVQVNNPGAICFWQRMGYAITSGPRDYPDGTTAYDLRKNVTEI